MHTHRVEVRAAADEAADVSSNVPNGSPLREMGRRPVTTGHAVLVPLAPRVEAAAPARPASAPAAAARVREADLVPAAAVLVNLTAAEGVLVLDKVGRVRDRVVGVPGTLGAGAGVPVQVVR